MGLHQGFTRQTHQPGQASAVTRTTRSRSRSDPGFGLGGSAIVPALPCSSATVEEGGGGMLVAPRSFRRRLSLPSGSRRSSAD